MPSLEHIYAHRTIYHGYKNAFTDLGHEFFTLTSNDDLEETLGRVRPHIFITTLHDYHLKFLDLAVLKRYRDQGMVMFTWVPFWTSPISKLRINEAGSLKDEPKKIRLIKEGLLGDVFFNQIPSQDRSMRGFSRVTGKKHHTILLAADKTLIYPEYSKGFTADISFIGTYLPEKRRFFKKRVFPLKKKYILKLYGQDWTFADRVLGLVQKAGQYYNINILKKIRKPKMLLEDERKVYSSSKICINVHEDYQKSDEGNINERLFKILACKGFQITDYVKSMDAYFTPQELVHAKNEQEWFEKIDYYITHPQERKRIAEAGYKKVMKYHTYHNRAQQIIALYTQHKSGGA